MGVVGRRRRQGNVKEESHKGGKERRLQKEKN